MTLSIGAATDYLIAKAQLAVNGITVNGKPVQVVDGWPEELTFGMFVVGAGQPPPEIVGEETTGTRMWAALGGGRLEEDYTIPCYIDVRLSGTQKAVRDLSAAIFDAFWPLIKADLTLGGVLTGGRWAEVVDLTFIPSNVGTAAEPGSRNVITFGVHCRNITS